VLLAALLAIPAVVGIDVVESRRVETPEEQQAVALLCAALAERTLVPASNDCGASSASADRVEVRLFGGPTRVLVSAQRIRGSATTIATAELVRDMPDTWRAELARLIAVLVEPTRAVTVAPTRDISRPTDETTVPVPWILAGASVLSTAGSLLFYGLSQGAESTLESRRYEASEHDALIASAERDRALSAILLGTAMASLAASIVVARLE
jgi:hypothetical protein